MEEIDAWLKATGMGESRLGQLACANPHAIRRIRAETAPIKTLTAVLAFIREHPAQKMKKPERLPTRPPKRATFATAPRYGR